MSAATSPPDGNAPGTHNAPPTLVAQQDTVCPELQAAMAAMYGMAPPVGTEPQPEPEPQLRPLTIHPGADVITHIVLWVGGADHPDHARRALPATACLAYHPDGITWVGGANPYPGPMSLTKDAAGEVVPVPGEYDNPWDDIDIAALAALHPQAAIVAVDGYGIYESRLAAAAFLTSMAARTGREGHLIAPSRPDTIWAPIARGAKWWGKRLTPATPRTPDAEWRRTERWAPIANLHFRIVGGDGAGGIRLRNRKGEFIHRTAFQLTNGKQISSIHGGKKAARLWDSLSVRGTDDKGKTFLALRTGHIAAAMVDAADRIPDGNVIEPIGPGYHRIRGLDVFHLGDRIRIGTDNCNTRRIGHVPGEFTMGTPTSTAPDDDRLTAAEMDTWAAGMTSTRIPPNQADQAVAHLLQTFCAGAVPFRIHAWYTTKMGRGKSDIITIYTEFLAGSGVLAEEITDSSMRRDTAGVTGGCIVDEAESTKVRDHIALSTMLIGKSRGASDPKGNVSRMTDKATGKTIVQRMESSFVCASIHAPNMEDADRSRWIRVDMQHTAVPDYAQAMARMHRLHPKVRGHLVRHMQHIRNRGDNLLRLLRGAIGEGGRGMDPREAQRCATLTTMHEVRHMRLPTQPRTYDLADIIPPQDVIGHRPPSDREENDGTELLNACYQWQLREDAGRDNRSVGGRLVDVAREGTREDQNALTWDRTGIRLHITKDGEVGILHNPTHTAQLRYLSRIMDVQYQSKRGGVSLQKALLQLGHGVRIVRLTRPDGTDDKRQRFVFVPPTALDEYGQPELADHCRARQHQHHHGNVRTMNGSGAPPPSTATPPQPTSRPAPHPGAQCIADMLANNGGGGHA